MYFIFIGFIFKGEGIVINGVFTAFRIYLLLGEKGKAKANARKDKIGPISGPIRACNTSKVFSGLFGRKKCLAFMGYLFHKHKIVFSKYKNNI